MTYFRLSEWKRRASIDSDHPAPLSSQPWCLLLPQRPWLRPEAACAHSCGDDCHVEFLGASRKQCRDRHHRITAGETLTGAWRGGERVGSGHPSSHHGREGHRLHCSGYPCQPWGALEEMAARSLHASRAAISLSQCLLPSESSRFDSFTANPRSPIRVKRHSTKDRFLDSVSSTQTNAGDRLWLPSCVCIMSCVKTASELGALASGQDRAHSRESPGLQGRCPSWPI